MTELFYIILIGLPLALGLLNPGRNMRNMAGTVFGAYFFAMPVAAGLTRAVSQFLGAGPFAVVFFLLAYILLTLWFWLGMPFPRVKEEGVDKAIGDRGGSVSGKANKADVSVAAPIKANKQKPLNNYRQPQSYNTPAEQFPDARNLRQISSGGWEDDQFFYSQERVTKRQRRTAVFNTKLVLLSKRQQIRLIQLSPCKPA